MKNIHYLLTIIFCASLFSTLQAQPKNEAAPVTFEFFEQKLRETARPQILDVRSPEEFAENHLAGAINLGAANDDAFEKGIGRLDKGRPVFVYSINNGRSGVVASRLRERGFGEVYALPGGLANWIGKGKPVESANKKGISYETFRQTLQADNLVLVNVGSRHCGSCRKLAPVVDSIAQEQTGVVRVVKIELYDNRALADTLNIEAVPTLILYKNGRRIWSKSGTTTKVEIQDALDNSL